MTGSNFFDKQVKDSLWANWKSHEGVRRTRCEKTEKIQQYNTFDDWLLDGEAWAKHMLKSFGTIAKWWGNFVRENALPIKDCIFFSNSPCNMMRNKKKSLCMPCNIESIIVIMCWYNVVNKAMILGRYCDRCFAIVDSLFRVFVTFRAGRDQINCKTKFDNFDFSPHTVDVISVHADFLWRPSWEKDSILA